MGRAVWSAEVFNCSAPDTGNMETFERYGSDAQKERWLERLLAGEIRSAFLMTEPAVASSDATNIECRIRLDGDHYIVNGRKSFSSGAGDARCAIFIVMGKTDPDAPRHQQQSMVLVPRDTPGVTVVRALTVFGYDDAPHGHMEVTLDDVRVPASNLLLGEGRGFEIAQGRLGRGGADPPLHALDRRRRARARDDDRSTPGSDRVRPAAREQSIWHERIAESRCLIDQARLLLTAAYLMDTVGNNAAKAEIAMIKVVAPNVSCKVVDWAIQALGAAGVSQDFRLAEAYAHQRTVRIVDGPDEVHRNAIAKLELAKRTPARRAGCSLTAGRAGCGEPACRGPCGLCVEIDAKFRPAETAFAKLGAAPTGRDGNESPPGFRWRGGTCPNRTVQRLLSCGASSGSRAAMICPGSSGETGRVRFG
jgi:acyl-CoA dehydrogenase